MVVRLRGEARHSGFTIAYHISSIGGVIHWWIWFGHRGDYHSLPLLHSGSDPAAGHLYQQLPPRPRARVMCWL